MSPPPSGLRVGCQSDASFLRAGTGVGPADTRAQEAPGGDAVPCPCRDLGSRGSFLQDRRPAGVGEALPRGQSRAGLDVISVDIFPLINNWPGDVSVHRIYLQYSRGWGGAGSPGHSLPSETHPRSQGIGFPINKCSLWPTASGEDLPPAARSRPTASLGRGFTGRVSDAACRSVEREPGERGSRPAAGEASERVSLAGPVPSAESAEPRLEEGRG